MFTKTGNPSTITEVRKSEGGGNKKDLSAATEGKKIGKKKEGKQEKMEKKEQAVTYSHVDSLFCSVQ